MLITPHLPTLAVVLSLSVPTLALGGASKSFFPANLAKRLTGSLPAFKRSSPVISKERSVNQEIKDILARANVAAASPSPSATYAATAAATAEPSASQAYAREKAKRDMDYVKKLLKSTPWEVLDSSLLCPAGTTACPIFPRMGSYECVDLDELENCGGCASKGEGEDCTQIRGAQGVTCDAGLCKVFTCQNGFSLQRDGKGRERCKKTKTTMV